MTPSTKAGPQKRQTGAEAETTDAHDPKHKSRSAETAQSNPVQPRPWPATPPQPNEKPANRRVLHYFSSLLEGGRRAS
jgi:hypothetical protein